MSDADWTLASVTPWDLALVVVVSLQTTLVAYMPTPKLKSIFLTLPFPFTIVALSVGLPMDAANVLSMGLLFAYIHAIRLLHDHLRIPIVAAIGLALSGYSVGGWLLADVVPSGPVPFWLATGAAVGVGSWLLVRNAPRAERAHRTQLPVWLKLPAVMLVVCFLVFAKRELGGFAALFPLVSVVGAYEARHCLWTLSLTPPFLMLTMVPLMAVTFVAQQWIGLGGGLVAGWAVMMLIYVPLTRWQWRRWPAPSNS